MFVFCELWDTPVSDRCTNGGDSGFCGWLWNILVVFVMTTVIKDIINGHSISPASSPTDCPTDSPTDNPSNSPCDSPTSSAFTYTY